MKFCLLQFKLLMFMAFFMGPHAFAGGRTNLQLLGNVKLSYNSRDWKVSEKLDILPRNTVLIQNAKNNKIRGYLKSRFLTKSEMAKGRSSKKLLKNLCGGEGAFRPSIIKLKNGDLLCVVKAKGKKEFESITYQFLKPFKFKNKSYYSTHVLNFPKIPKEFDRKELEKLYEGFY